MPIEHIETLREGESGKETLHVVEESGVAPWQKDADLSIVGRPHTRIEGEEKVIGRARYAYDIRLPGQLYARVLRSPHSPRPHPLHRYRPGRSVERSARRPLCGQHPQIPWYQESHLFDTTVRFAGEEVAAVAAETEEIALDALRLIEVEYELLPFVTDAQTALAEDAPHIHEGGNRAGEARTYERGDPDAGFAEADVIVDQTYVTHTALHNCLEPHGCTAFWEGERLTLYESTQGNFEVREQVAEKLGLPEDHVRVIKHNMGGGFGSKQIAWKQTVIAALLARVLAEVAG